MASTQSGTITHRDISFTVTSSPVTCLTAPAASTSSGPTTPLQKVYTTSRLAARTCSVSLTLPRRRVFGSLLEPVPIATYGPQISPKNTPDLLLTPSPRPRQVAVALRSGVQMDHSGRRGPATRHIINHGSPGLPKSARSLRTTRLPTGEYVCSPNSWQTENPKRLTEFAARHPKSDRKRAPGDSPLR